MVENVSSKISDSLSQLSTNHQMRFMNLMYDIIVMQRMKMIMTVLIIDYYEENKSRKLQKEQDFNRLLQYIDTGALQLLDIYLLN